MDSLLERVRLVHVFLCIGAIGFGALWFFAGIHQKTMILQSEVHDVRRDIQAIEADILRNESDIKDLIKGK